MKLLLVGVGGVGCEFLILLEEYLNNEPSTEPIEIFIIDNDVVEESNLSRQRLYTSNDIGHPKVEAAAAKAINVKVTPLKADIQSITDSKFFAQFNVFVLAVDNLETRRWLNSTLFQVAHGDWFLMDLGVQGFKFSIRTVTKRSSCLEERSTCLGERSACLEKRSACLECTLPLYLHDETDEIPVCSFYGQPRDLKDCVYWSLPRSNNNDIKDIYDLTKQRAAEYFIDTSELSFSYIKNLVTRSIPAVASVNSVLAAKGLELMLRRGEILNNFWMVNMENGYYEFEALLEPEENCIICSMC